MRLLAVLGVGLFLLPQGLPPAAATGPAARRIALPATPGAHAIWGATGQDSRGRIWFGVAAADTPTPSGHLLEYDPVSGVMTPRGNVIAELARLKLLRAENDHQAKIHSKIVEGPDGCLYFASMDEEGESESRLRLPVWGGHLWRLRLATGRWEHLGATAEALIAVARGGRFIYALGYFGHVLYQYDTKSGVMRQLRVGSVGAHITRNFLADARGHVYVPRLTSRPGPDGRAVIDVHLAEFDDALVEVGAARLESSMYFDGDGGSHGIIALQTMNDGTMYFTTHRGQLYRVVPPRAAAGAAAPRTAATVTALGWMHPDGPMYVPSLFTANGVDALSALARHPKQGYQWLDCQVSPEGNPSMRCAASPFVVEGMSLADVNNSLLYGSGTRDAGGGHYVVGLGPGPVDADPVAIRVVGRPAK